MIVPVAGTIMTDAPALWPISILIYNIGLLYCFSMVPHKAARLIIYNIVAALLFVIESSFFFSYYLQNAGFNNAFFYHLRSDLIYAGVKGHLPILLAILACLFGFLTLSSTCLAHENSRKGVMPFVSLALLGLGLFISPPAKNLALYLKNISSTTSKHDPFENFHEFMAPSVSVQFLKSKKNNIILIYAESLAQRYFDEAVFPNLLPHLKKIKEQSTDFTNVSQGVGAGWTVAGMVASQCGYPLAVSFDINGNDLAMFDEYLPRAVCLGDLLEKDGYSLSFIGGADARFGGKSEFLGSHGYKNILGRDDLLSTLDDNSYRNYWGAFDDTLFDYAFKKFSALSAEKTPFLLTLLTLDTHDPDGFLSKSCEAYGAGDNSTLNSVHCDDLLIAKFIEQVRNSPYSDDTLIFVVSDHLPMRNQASSLLEASQMPKRLTFFENTPNGKKETNTNPGLHYDIAPTILDLVGYTVRGHLGFGAPLTQGPGYLPGRFGENKWEEQSADLEAIGNTLWDTDVTLDLHGIDFAESNLSLAIGGRKFDLHPEKIAKNGSASTLFVFDADSLKLEKILAFPFDKGLTPEDLTTALLEQNEKLVLVISPAGYLRDFSDPQIDPSQWVFFFGKPGSDFFFECPIAGDLSIPFNVIQGLSKNKTTPSLHHKRTNVRRA